MLHASEGVGLRRRLAATLTAGVGAALALTLIEVLRAVAASASPLGGFGFALGVAGLLGLPAAVLGLGFWIAADLTGAGWRWGRAGGVGSAAGGSEKGGVADGVRGAAWVLFGVFALAGLTVGVMQATILFTQWFKRPVYQGLGAGLTASALVLLMVALAGPGVGLFSRGLGRLHRRVPAALDPTRRLGALVWIGLLLLIGAFGVPALRAELHTVDLRPARLGLLWAVLLFAFRALLLWRPMAPKVSLVLVAASLATLAGFAGAFAWSASHLGASQTRKVAMERDTLLAGAVLARLTRLGDADADGVSRWFGGGDCDDTNPQVRPGVYDAPKDGVDQNCTGADLDPQADPLPDVPRPAPTGERPDWHVILLTVDALRYDTYREHMPRLNAIATESQDYTHAYSHGAATYWSLPALLQSTMPSRLHMGRDQTPVAQETLLTEVLQANGWATALFANVTVFFVRGLRQGTDVADYSTSDFTVHGAKPGSAHLTDRVLAHVDAFQAGRLRVKRDRMFLWAHYYDPHDPYFEVPGYPAADGSDRARYEAIARYTDEHIGRLVDGLKAKGEWDRTLLVVTADHGDEFYDHGHRFHGATLYDEMVHVPLILRVPGLPGRQHTTPAGHMDVAPTVLDLLGVAAPDFSTLGRSRAEEMRTGTPAAVVPVYFEVFPDSNYAGHQVGVRVGDLKLIHRLHSNSFELYDLAADPQERENRFDDHPEAEALRTLLLTYVDHHLYWLAFNRTGAKLPPGTPDPPPRFVAPKRGR